MPGVRAAAVTAILLGTAAVAHADLPRVSLQSPEALMLVITDAVADPPAELARGATVEIGTLLPGSAWRESAAALDDELEALGATVVARGSTATDEHRTIELAGGARATLVIRPGGGSVSLTPRPIEPRLRGKCVAIPAVNHTVRRHSNEIRHPHGRHHQGRRRMGDMHHAVGTTRFHDLDGDAVLDAMVPSLGATSCPDEATWDVYIVRGTCGHHVGTVGPGQVTPRPTRHHGLADLVTTHRVSKTVKGQPEIQTATTTYAMKRGRYRKVKTVRSEPGRCRHCAVSTCALIDP
jgi:hypothetical protein